MSEGISETPNIEKEKTEVASFLNKDTTSLTTRLLLGEKALNPTINNLPEIKSDHFNGDHLSNSASRIEALSQKERKAFWKDKGESTLEAQKASWSEAFSASIVKKLNSLPAEEQETWKNTFSTLGVNHDSINESVMKMYDIYFTGDNHKTNLDKFVINILTKHTVDDEPDYAGLKRSMPAIKWMAHMFGKDTAAIIPSLLEATICSISESPIVKNQLVYDANEPSGSVSRINNPKDEEIRLLQLLYESKPISEQSRQSPKDEIPIPYDADLVNKINTANSGFLDSAGNKLSFFTLAKQFIDSETGEAFPDETQPEYHTHLSQKIEQWRKKVDADTEGKDYPKDSPSLTITPALFSQIDMIAQESNNKGASGLELGFHIIGTTHRTANKHTAMIGAAAIADHDFQQASKDSHTVNSDIVEKNRQKVVDSTGIKDLLDKNPYLMQIHIHHLGLGEKNIDTPSPKDYAEEKRILRESPLAVFRWGIATHDKDGKLHLRFFESTKKDGKIVRKPIKIHILHDGDQS